MLKLLTALAMAIGAPTLALAATDGSLGDSSSGTANITFNVTDAAAPQIQVSGLEDMSLEGELGDFLSAAASRFCIYMDQIGGQYSMAVSANPLTSGQDNYPYTAIITDVISSTSTPGVQIGTESATVNATGLTPFYAADECTSDNRAAALVLIMADARPAKAVVASTTITITVSPD